MPHATATLSGTTLAETDTYEVIDGNIYFPPSSLSTTHFTPTSTTSKCPYKGLASYYSIDAGGKTLKDAAWYYAEPKSGYEKIKGYVAFYKGKVDVTSE